MAKTVRYLAAVVSALVATGLLIEMTPAQARGGGASFMNSPGYQRRLQESRGYVTNESGPVLTPRANAVPRLVKPKRRHRH